MELALAIKHINSTLKFGKDFEVLDDNQGEGPYIKWYTKEITQPTQAELETAWVEVEKIETEIKTKSEKSEAINKIATLSDQLNLMASVLDTITSENPDQELIQSAKATFVEIKTILNN